MKPLRILLLAEQNNPDWVSVPLVGYHHSAALAKIHEVTLLTHEENREAIERQGDGFKEIIGLELGRLDQVFAWLMRVVFKYDYGSQALTAVRIPFYWAFEWYAWRKMRARIQAGEFDLVLRLTPVAPVLSSVFGFCLRRGPVPFVIGPINGGLPWPKGFAQAERQREWISGLRFLYKFLPFSRVTYSSAAAVIVGSSETYKNYQKYAHKLFFIPENGIREDMVKAKKARAADAPLELIFVGRLVPYKACDLALKAAAPLLRQGLARFTVVGEGPERAVLETLSRELGVAGAVSFSGVVPHAEAMERLAAADVLVFPSIREFGGGVVFEALACGTVPIVSAYGGPGDLVHPEIGFKIPLSDEPSSVQAITAILEKLAAERETLAQLSAAGQAWARTSLGWNGKALQTTAVLRWCLKQAQRPLLIPPSRR